MSAEFSNKYQEILFDNFVSVVKQNLIFQTQIKLTEGAVKERDEFKEKNEKTIKELTEAKNQISHLTPFKTKFVENSTTNEDRQRLQIALNDYMKKHNILKEENEELKKYVELLESNFPASKLKKIKNNEKESQDELNTDSTLDNISTF